MRVFLLIFFILSGNSFLRAQTYSEVLDKLVAEKLKSENQKPRALADDLTFVRRIYLDLAGRIPTLVEVESFMKERSTNKRSELVDLLLKSESHVSAMSNFWGDFLRITYVPDQLHSPHNYAEYVKDVVRTNKPYDKFVYELVTSEGELYKPGNGAVGFYARETMQLDHLSSTVKAFLGLNLECAQCHDHPFDDWTQRNFYELAAFTSQINLRVDPTKDEYVPYVEDNKRLKPDFDKWIVLREALRIKHAKVLGSGTGMIRLPEDYKYDDAKPSDLMQANVLFGAMPTMHFKVKPEQLQKQKNKKSIGEQINAKEAFAQWLTDKENPLFTKAIVNRLWERYMGTELIGPLTNLEEKSIGPHPQLTAFLVKIMKEANYDLRKFQTVLLNSKTYQKKAIALKGTEKIYLFDGPVERRMSAEQMWDSHLSLIMKNPDQSLLGKFRHNGYTHFYERSQKLTPEQMVHFVETSKLGRGSFYKQNQDISNKQTHEPGVEYRSDYMRISEIEHPLKGSHMAKMFGMSTREVIDGSNMEPNIPQALLKLNGYFEDRIINDKKSQLNIVVNSVEKMSDKINQLYLFTLCRLPTAKEKEVFKLDQLNEADLADLTWVLINSNEFLFRR
jgi:hypothetical protein